MSRVRSELVSAGIVPLKTRKLCFASVVGMSLQVYPQLEKRNLFAFSLSLSPTDYLGVS